MSHADLRGPVRPGGSVSASLGGPVRRHEDGKERKGVSLVQDSDAGAGEKREGPLERRKAPDALYEELCLEHPPPPVKWKGSLLQCALCGVSKTLRRLQFMFCLY